MAAQNRRKAEAEETRKGSSSEEEEESTEENEDLAEESDTESEGDKNEPPPSKKQQLSSLPQHSSSSDDDTESDSEMDLQSNAIRKLTPEVKPVSPKPMGEPSQASKKSRSKPTTDAPPSGLSSSKRPADSPASQKGRDSKKAKKKEQVQVVVEAVEDERSKKTGDDTKRQFFQRLWSEDDEIAILKGLIEHAENQGVDPVSADMTSFYDFIRKSLHVDASKSQLTEKLRRLKKKYQTTLEKSKNGDDDITFLKAHNKTGYDLSKKIWGTDSNGSLGTDSVKVKKRKKADANVKRTHLASPKLEKSLPTDTAKEQKNIDMEVDQAAVVTATPFRAEPFYTQTGDSSLEKEIMKYGSQLITGSKKLELEGKLKQLQVKEIEVYLQRLDYMREQAALVLEALKSSAH